MQALHAIMPSSRATRASIGMETSGKCFFRGTKLCGVDFWWVRCAEAGRGRWAGGGTAWSLGYKKTKEEGEEGEEEGLAANEDEAAVLGTMATGPSVEGLSGGSGSEERGREGSVR